MLALTAYERPSSDEDLHLRRIHLPVNEQPQIMSPANQCQHEGELAYLGFISEPKKTIIKVLTFAKTATYSLNIETFDRYLRVADYLYGAKSLILQGMSPDPLVQCQDKRSTKFILSIIFENRQTSELVIISPRHLVNTNGTNRGERWCQPQEKMCGIVFHTVEKVSECFDTLDKVGQRAHRSLSREEIFAPYERRLFSK